MTGLIRREDVAALLMADPGTLFTARGWNHALNAVLALPAAPALVVPAEGPISTLEAVYRSMPDIPELPEAYQPRNIARSLAALRSAPPVEARVKQLMWEEAVFCGQPAAYAETEFGAWMVVAYLGRSGRWAHTDPTGADSEDDWETRFEAQAAAQADYERRILAALLPAGEDR